jgi:hypothetical protein
MGLVIALGGLGIGYGLWTDLLEVSGTVETGFVDAKLTKGEVDQGTVTEEEAVYNNDNVDDDVELEGKDIAECVATLGSQTDPALGSNVDEDATNDKLTVTITNGYPSFSCFVEVDVQNIGTIPIKIDALTITNNNPTQIEVDVVHPDATGELVAGCWDDGLQLEPGATPATGEDTEDATVFGVCVIRVHVLQAAAESQTGANAYSFSASISADQWNEYTDPTP